MARTPATCPLSRVSASGSNKQWRVDYHVVVGPLMGVIVRNQLRDLCETVAPRASIELAAPNHQLGADIAAQVNLPAAKFTCIFVASVVIPRSCLAAPPVLLYLNHLHCPVLEPATGRVGVP